MAAITGPGVEPDSRAHQLQCEEIWGGVQATKTTLSVPGLDVTIISRPFRDEAGGGDIHYVGLCGRGLLSRFIVADVSGHGAVVTDLAKKLHDMMAVNMNTPDQTELLKALNVEFGALAELGKFATAIMMTYLSPVDHLAAINAGHPRPLWYSSVDRVWRVLRHESPSAVAGLMDMPLGMVAHTGYHQFAVPLSKGDLIVLYSDSLTEATNPAGELLGEKGLVALAEKVGIKSPQDYADRLLAAVAEYQGGMPIQDDLTLLTLHRNGDVPNSDQGPVDWPDLGL